MAVRVRPGERPRHLMVVHNNWPDPRVEREARALVAAGFEVDVFALRGEHDPPDSPADGLNVQRLPIRRRKGAGPRRQIFEYSAFFFAAGARLVARHARRRYRTIQVHNPPDFLVFATLPAKLTGARVILDLHDLMPEFFASRFGRSADSSMVRAIRWQERMATSFADHVITVTENWRRTLIGRGVPAGKVSVVMNLPDPAVFGTRLPPARRGDGPFTLIYHGTLTRRYGVDLMIRAAERARNEIPIRLIIHGRGDERDNLVRLAEELGIADLVEFTPGVLPSEELPALIRQADAGVVSYRRDAFTDGILPTKLLEYAALGVPVIATRTPAIEAHFSEKAVRFVPDSDQLALSTAIVELAGDPALRLRLARNAKRFVTANPWQATAARYVELVRDLGTR